MASPHTRSLWKVQGEEAYAAKCSCGWAGRIYSTKRDAASAHGMHVAAARRKEHECSSLVCNPTPRPDWSHR